MSVDDSSEASSSDDTCSPTFRRRRKCYKPTRSASKTDPSFKGATVSMMTHVKDGDSHLFISAHFSNVNYLLNKRNHGCGESFYGLYGSLSEDEDLPESQETANYYFPCSSKMCASCSTRRTPLWRDAEDGTPLCNACGIRFKKYRMRCGHCWHIPKKDVKTYPNCPVCGSVLRITVGRRSTW
ncbi:ZGLP1 [Mytilus edulis]|uniref:ZGLP1 n=1 Tax=Mytilus edulis TaxID=6550 RepID=A0A8S3RLC4_MYTED|nr:ZGLP1 [Mytilus edulis]